MDAGKGVSIIVPIYNSEKTLGRCIESILKQTYTNFELLLIDDGSTDSSAEICRSYAASDERIRLIQKENTGVSDTRNAGIEMASGKYLQFVDSDDWIAPEMTGLMFHHAEENNCEMVISDFYRVVGERLAHKGDIHEDGLQTKETFAGCMMENPADFYYGVLWNKFYRHDVIKKYGLKMDGDVSWCEDFMFNLEYIRHIKQIYVLRIPLYYYVKTKGSLISQGTSITKTIEMKQRVFEYYKRFYQDVFNEADFEKSRMQVYRFYFDAASDGIVPPSVLPGIFRLGEERISVDPGLLRASGMMADIYRERKLYERYMELVALRYDLTLRELYVLLYLKINGGSGNSNGLAEFTGLKRRKLAAALRRLAAHNYIRWEEAGVKGEADQKKTKDAYEIELLCGADPVMEELTEAGREYEKLCYLGFSSEEIESFRQLKERLQINIKNQLA